MTRIFFVFAALPFVAFAAGNYRAERALSGDVEIIRLSDAKRGTVVSVAPALGNRAVEFKVHGNEILYFPLANAAALKNSERPLLNGIPFLAPWANRIAGGGFWSEGTHYLFNPAVGTVRIDPNGIAIHGMLTLSPLWEVTEVKATGSAAELTCKLAFWKHPELMANWPFAHQYSMMYRLADGVLEVQTSVANLSSRAMPMSLGFHPYFQIPGAPRDEWTVHLPVTRHVETDSHLVATGQLNTAELAAEISLRGRTFDDGFTGLVRDRTGKATFSLSAGNRKVQVDYGPKYTVAVIYAPPRQNFVCFEPMTAITNGVNLAHEGKYTELQHIAPSETWSESFFVRTQGF